MSQIILSLLTGLISALIYSLIQGIYLYFRWSKTRRFFTGEIRKAMGSISYYLMDVFEIRAIYDTELEVDHLITDEEIIEEINSRQINAKQFKQVEFILKDARGKILELRKEALTIPSFSSLDFHAVDKFVHEMSNFISWYSWYVDDLEDLDAHNSLKGKLISAINQSFENPFPNNNLDNLQNWYRNKLRGKLKF